MTDEQLIQRLRAALERESAEVVPPPDLLASIHEELRDSPAAKRHRWRAPFGGLRLLPAYLAAVASLLVVVAVVAVFLGVHGRKPAGHAAAHGGFALVFRAEPTSQAPAVNQAVIARAVSLIRRRIAAVVPGGNATIAVTSVGTKISVHAASQTRISQHQLLSLLGTTARMVFYDWEANALTPSGQTVASLLATRNPTALKISQGTGGSPGSPGQGSMPLYQAVQLASKQPKQVSKNNARLGPEYFAFDAAGSAGCAKAALYYRVTPLVGQHCYLAGPADNLGNLQGSLPAGVSLTQAQVLRVQQGTVLLQAISPNGYGRALAWSDPTAQYFALNDHVALFGTEITHPRQSTDASGQPDVSFGFTGKGDAAFQRVTAQIAHRGGRVSGRGQQLNQHFAVALDTQLITVPFIDFKTFPNGIQAASGGDITGGFTLRSAQDLATQLRLGWLPINLKLIAVVPQH